MRWLPSIKLVLIFGKWIEKNRKTYNGEMSGFDLTDQEVSDVLNYIRNSFGNKGGAVTPAEVKAARK